MVITLSPTRQAVRGGMEGTGITVYQSQVRGRRRKCDIGLENLGRKLLVELVLELMFDHGPSGCQRSLKADDIAATRPGPEECQHCHSTRGH